MGKTGISWTDETWNPTKGCSRTAPAGSNQSGCGDSSGGGCYAEQQAGRIVRMAKGKPCAYDGLVRLTSKGYRWTGKVTLHPDALALPLRWTKPRRIFVDSMSDLFHDELTNEQIAAVVGVMAACPQHTFQVLTKRAQRMREWFEWALDGTARGGFYDATFLNHLTSKAGLRWEANPKWLAHCEETEDTCASWPLPNVWVGTSVENQSAADERIPELLKTPAAIRFLSCEPLLGPVDLRGVERGNTWSGGDWLRSFRFEKQHDDGRTEVLEERKERIDWVIAGCESGDNARKAETQWFRSLRDQCAAADVAFFLKQAVCYMAWTAGGIVDTGISFGPGSKATRSLIELPYLDGVQHAAFPEASNA